jgi:hypothetical protein
MAVPHSRLRPPFANAIAVTAALDTTMASVLVPGALPKARWRTTPSWKPAATLRPDGAVVCVCMCVYVWVVGSSKISILALFGFAWKASHANA